MSVPGRYSVVSILMPVLPPIVEQGLTLPIAQWFKLTSQACNKFAKLDYFNLRMWADNPLVMSREKSLFEKKDT